MRPRALGCLLIGAVLATACGDASLALPPALALTRVSPHHGATGVSTSTSVELEFDAALDSATISATSVRLEAAGSAVACQRLLSADGQLLTLVPDAVLAADTAHELVIDRSLRGVDTAPLASTLRSRFRTEL